MFCERCGLLYLPVQSVCTGCRVAPTRHWFQLMSLATLTVAIAGNALVAWMLLPRLTTVHQTWSLFRVWLWLNEKGSLYGWAPVALGLMAWDFFIGRVKGTRLRGWMARLFLTIALIVGVAPLFSRWAPAARLPEGPLAALANHPGLPPIVAWTMIVIVAVLLCSDPESRDSLLGNGRVLSLISLGVLLLVLTMTLVGWSVTYRWSVPSGG